MPHIPKVIQSRRKRQHTEVLDNSTESQSPKRRKADCGIHSQAFYDSLSKVPLTHRALKEFDRRTSHLRVTRHTSPLCIPTHQAEFSKQLQRFARHGGPELLDVRRCPGPSHTKSQNPTHTNSQTTSSSSQSRRTTSITSNPASTSIPASTSSKRSSAYDRAFEQHLVDNGIFPRGYQYPNGRQTPKPDNLQEIRDRLARARSSLSPSQFTQSDFRTFDRANDETISKAKVLRTIFPIVYGSRGADIPNESDLLFSQLESMTKGVTVDAKPDFCDGARPEDIDLRVQEDLAPYIVPSRHTNAPAAGNFFAEVKGKEGNSGVAQRQACYDGALGARAMHKLQSYGQNEPIFDNKAHALSATFVGGSLMMYATHATPTGVGGSPEYHTTSVGGWQTIGDVETCRRGFRALRNGRDWAKEQRDNLIAATNNRARIAVDEGGGEEADEEEEEEGEEGNTTENPPPEESKISTDELCIDQRAKQTPLPRKRSRNASQNAVSKTPRPRRSQSMRMLRSMA